MVHKLFCLIKYDHFGQYDVKKKKRPCEECPCGPGHATVWVKKNHPIIQSNNPIQYSYQITLFNTYPINIPQDIYTYIWESWIFDIFKKVEFST